MLLPLVLSQVVTTAISGYVIKYTGHAWWSFTLGFFVWLAGQGAQLCFDESTGLGVVVMCLLLQGLGIGSTIQSSKLPAFNRDMKFAEISSPSSSAGVR